MECGTLGIHIVVLLIKLVVVEVVHQLMRRVVDMICLMVNTKKLKVMLIRILRLMQQMLRFSGGKRMDFIGYRFS